VDILDMLFLGWLLLAFVVVAAINLYLRFFGLPKYRKGRGIVAGQPVSLVTGAEKAEWLNAVLAWIYGHYRSTPEVIETWLRALSEEAKHHAVGEYQMRFDRIQSGCPPPRIIKVATDASSPDSLTVRADIECSECILQVALIQQTATSVKVSNCDVSLNKLCGQLRLHGTAINEEIQLVIGFIVPPEMTVSAKPRNYDANLDARLVESMVRSAVSGAVFNIALPSHGGFPSFFAASHLKANGVTPFQQQPLTQAAMTARSSRVNEAPVQAATMPPVSAAPGSSSLQGRRLLVKVIKANGLGDKDFGCADPYCVVLLDDPIQKHTTSVVRNTVNPFWDEHFIFDLDDLTRQVKFEVYNQGKSIEDEFLGRATVQMEELRRMPSSRQIIPLTGRPRATTSTSGSITVEFLFMEGPQDSQMSPKRRIETSRMMMPGGTMVTTTTTTTEKPRDHQMLNSPFHNDMPSQIEKTDLLSRGPGGVGTMQLDSPYVRQSSAHDAALNVSQVGRSNISPTISVTDSHMDSATLPRIQTNDMSPYDEGAEVKKSKSFASTLKKRFARPKKHRSQSADRAQTSSSLREGSLLKPPSHQSQHRTDDDLDQGEFVDGHMRKSRSHSFSSSLRKLFKGGKKSSGKKDASRESSLSRASNRYDASHEGSQGMQNSPDMSYNNRGDLSLRHSTPTPEYDQSQRYPYSMSVPQNASPLYDH
jgi:hypothetical protein